MDLPLRLEQIDISQPLSPVFLLKRGFTYIQQNRYAEGVALLNLVREQLSPRQSSLAAELDSLVQVYRDYQRSLLMLQEAVKGINDANSVFVFRVDQLEQKLLKFVCTIESCDQPPVDGKTHLPPSYTDTEGDMMLPALYVTCLERFEVWRDGKAIQLCQNRSGQCIFRYLIAHAEHSATADVLQTLFWPEDEPRIAQRKLYSAISALRRSLNEGIDCEHNGGYITYKNRVYGLNPVVIVQSDIDNFLRFHQLGKQEDCKRVEYYEKACQLYKRPFLLEDLYADWSAIRREQISQIYFTMCRWLADYYFKQRCYEDATTWNNAILIQNRCDEAAHRELIRIYAAQGRRSEALQQYQRCSKIIYEELSIQPSPETVSLVQTLLTNDGSLLTENT